MPNWMKDEGSTKPFDVHWSARLNGETIVSSEWSTPLEVMSSRIDGEKTTVTLKGGDAGSIYKTVNTITTSTGQVLQAYNPIKVINR